MNAHILPEHLFLSSVCGDLHDTRLANWSTVPPVRANYRRHYPTINTVAEFKATLRGGCTLDGGYPLYFIDNEGNAISFEAAHKSFAIYSREIEGRERGRIVACEVNWEDGDLHCDDSGARIPSAYADE